MRLPYKAACKPIFKKSHLIHFSRILKNKISSVEYRILFKKKFFVRAKSRIIVNVSTYKAFNLSKFCQL